jgi:hypothetical protein
MYFSFPEDARWNAAKNAVEFGVEIGEYVGVVRVPRHVFQFLPSAAPTTPQGCLEGYCLYRTRFERIAEKKLRRRQLTEDANVEISGRDLRERAGDESISSAHKPSRVDIPAWTSAILTELPTI